MEGVCFGLQKVILPLFKLKEMDLLNVENLLFSRIEIVNPNDVAIIFSLLFVPSAVAAEWRINMKKYIFFNNSIISIGYLYPYYD